MLNFSEAFVELRNGEAMRRAAWPAGQWLQIVGNASVISYFSGPGTAPLDWKPKQPDILANDWRLA